MKYRIFFKKNRDINKNIDTNKYNYLILNVWNKQYSPNQPFYKIINILYYKNNEYLIKLRGGYFENK